VSRRQGRLAIACCREGPNAGPDNLFPDIDAVLLQAALEELGIESVLVSWDDDRQRWDSFDAVVISSTWDAVDRPADYIEWVRVVHGSSPLLNAAVIVEATLDKRFLGALPHAETLLPKTSFVMPGDGWDPPSETFVVKPMISGGGRETAMYGVDELQAARDHVGRLHDRGTGVIVQEHVAAIEGRGEIKHVFIGGRFSHAIRTGPLLRPGVGVLERPWEVPTGADPVQPTEAELDFATAALDALQAGFEEPIVYARVDVVSRSREDVVLMEIEAIDPSLSLWASADAPAQLAREIAHSIG